MKRSPAEIEAQFREDRDPSEVIEARTAYTDAIVQQAAAQLATAIPVPFILTAVGGYGRRELFPHSDVDLLLAFANEEDLNGIKTQLSECWRVLWDAGLRVSHSVRTIAECCRLNEQNTELHVSLLDVRLLYGSADLFAQLSTRLPEFYRKHAPALTKRLAEMARQRHRKFNDTVYHLEPNIKEAPGGIRDLHLLRWLQQLHPQEQIRESLEKLDAARHLLFQVRCFLHFHSKRDNNLLSFELQDAIAKALPDEPIQPEEWMRQYYGCARKIYQPVLRALDHVESHDQSLFRQIRDFRSKYSSSELTVSRDRIFLRNPAEILSSSDGLFRLFTFVARHGLRLSWDAQRRLTAGLNTIRDTFAGNPGKWNLWREVLSQPHAALALREMQETGMLAVCMPEWHSVDSLVVRDFYHRYTVDEHTFVAVETIDDLVQNKAGTPSRFHDLANEEEDLAVLRFALLMHDIGKGTEPGDHVTGSMHTAAEIMERMQVPSAKRGDVEFLIEHHLDLSLVMTGRDLEDPATARWLSSRLGTQERLRQLTLLTYADISAVNPNAMTPWRLEQLWRVYTLGQEQLTRELVMDRIHDVRDPGHGALVSPRASAFLNGLPTRYLRTHARREIDMHVQLFERAQTDGVAVAVTRETGVYVASVVAKDHPGVFAALCGALASFGMNIVKAEAFSNDAGYLVDVFRFADPIRTLELNPGETERLQWTLECVVRGSIEVRDLLKRRRPRTVSTGTKILPRVRFNNEASDLATLIDFVGEDRPGLLYDLTSVLSKYDCNIELVMIDTEAHRAIDVFYVTQGGAKLQEQPQAALQVELVAAAMGE